MAKEKIIRGKELKETKKWVKSIVKQWHSKKPDYIFLTETAGTVYGYPLKEAWKKAYPNEKIPTFYRIDPTQIDGNEIQEEVNKYFQKRIKKDNPKIIVFDEGRDELKMKDFKKYSGMRVNSVERASGLIQDFLEKENKEGEIYSSRQGEPIIRHHTIVADPSHPGFQREKSKIYRRPTSKRWTGRATGRTSSLDEEKQFEVEDKPDAYFKGRIVKHPEQRKMAMSYIKELKKIGRRAGKELAIKNKLENLFSSIIGISALTLSLIFLSPTLTGNAIANLTTKTSSIIGAGLFIVGIVGSYFYFKRK